MCEFLSQIKAFRGFAIKEDEQQMKKQHVFLSLFLHLCLVAVMFLLSESPSGEKEPIEISYIQNSAPTPAEASIPPEEVKKPYEKNITKHTLKPQVVDQNEDAINSEIPTDSRFLSEHNQVVKRQSIANLRGEFKNRSTVGKGEFGDSNQNTKSKGLQNFLPKFDAAKSIRNSMLKEKEEFIKQLEKSKVTAENDSKLVDGKKGDPRAGKNGGEASQTLDYIPDIDPGLETVLSTKEFRFSGFYSRIKGPLGYHFSKQIRERFAKLAQTGRYVASSDDRVARLLVTLDSTGNLLRVQIIGKSGLFDLDEAAVGSFRMAAPFPNPPKGMQEADGTVKLLWEFVLQAA